MNNTVARLFFSFLFVLAAQNALAQSTIFNVPTTDTVSKGKAYLEFDFLPQIPAAANADRIYTYNPQFVGGVSGNIEAGANSFLTLLIRH
jgi:hypothetical protein